MYVDRFEDIEFLELCSREFIDQIHRRISRLNEIFHGAQFVGFKLGRNFGKIPAVQGLFAGILPKRSPRSAGLIPGLCKWKSQYPRYFPAPRGPWLQMTGA